MAGRSEKYEPNVGDVVLVLTGRHFGRVCTILVKCESGQTYWARTKSGAMAYLFEGEFIPHDLAKRTIENQTGRGPWWVPERGFEACGAVNLCSGVRCELPNHGGLHAAIVAGDVVVWRGARVRFRVHKTREVTGKCWECEGVRGPRRSCAACGGVGFVDVAHAVAWASDRQEKQNEERVET